MFAGKAAPAVAAGNAIIIKSSEKSPLSVREALIHGLGAVTDGACTQSLILAGLTVEAGFPPGIIQVLSGLGETGAALAEHPEIRKISFTVSLASGTRLARTVTETSAGIDSHRSPRR